MRIIQKIRSKVRRQAKYLGRYIGFALGINKRFFEQARGSRIVIYHGICQQDHTRFNPIFLTRDTFEEHLKLYKKYFNVVSLDDYCAGRFSDNKFNVCLTFDDGFANNYHYVLPLLEQYKIPATFFVTAIRKAGHDILWNDFLGIVSKYGPKSVVYKSEQYYKGAFNKYYSYLDDTSLVDKLKLTGFGDKAEMMEILYPLVPFKKTDQENDYWQQMTIGQVKAMSQSQFVTIGAHSVYHNDLSKISLPDAVAEMVNSKQFLEEVIQKPVNSFAFPYGAYTRALVEQAKASGFTQLLAMDFSFDEDRDDPFLKERFTVNPFISPVNQMHATITRKYEV